MAANGAVGSARNVCGGADDMAYGWHCAKNGLSLSNQTQTMKYAVEVRRGRVGAAGGRVGEGVGGREGGEDRNVGEDGWMKQTGWIDRIGLLD